MITSTPNATNTKPGAATRSDTDTLPQPTEQYVTAAEFPHELAEEVYDPVTGESMFELSQADGRKMIVDVLGSDRPNHVFRPLKSDLLAKGRLLLPTGSEDYGCTADLVGGIRTHLRRHLVLPGDDENTVLYYVLFSWLFDRFQTAPYLRFIGDLGTGKSRALKVVGDLCYKPFKVSGCASMSPIFRSLEEFGGCTLVMDEVDFFVRSEAHQEMMSMLRVGFQREVGVLRSERVGDNFVARDFDVFGPKVLAGRNNFPDPALESRCIRVYMQSGARLGGIPVELPPEYDALALTLRNQLLRWRFDHFFKPLRPVAALAIEHRLRQVYEPLAQVIDDPAALEALRANMFALQSEMTETRRSSFEGKVLAALLKRHGLAQAKGQVRVSVKDLAQDVQKDGGWDDPPSPRKVATACRGLGFTVERASEGRYVMFAPEASEEVLGRYGLAA